jgi:2',3'-cyclic-nucleotide 2'-phosphodiesterase (5'-nucleotidase family)
LDSLKEAHDNLLILDAGNFAFSDSRLSKNQIQKEYKQANLIAEIYKIIPYDIVNLGPYDLSGGYQYLSHLKEMKRKFTIVSANIYDQQKQTPYYKPYEIIKYGKKRLGILGITSQPPKNIPNIDIKPPLEVLQSQLNQLKREEKVDYTVLLAALNREDYKQLKESNLSPDLILMAMPRGRSRYLANVKGKLIAKAGHEGKYVGLLSAKINDPEAALTDISFASYKKYFVKRRIKNYGNYTDGQPIEEYLSDNKRMRDMYEQLIAERDKMNQIIDSASNPVDFELIPVELSVEPKKIVEDKIREFQRK